jgi:hypothetical protein
MPTSKDDTRPASMHQNDHFILQLNSWREQAVVPLLAPALTPQMDSPEGVWPSLFFGWKGTRLDWHSWLKLLPI